MKISYRGFKDYWKRVFFMLKVIFVSVINTMKLKWLGKL